jgi:hypothetical protein
MSMTKADYQACFSVTGCYRMLQVWPDFQSNRNVFLGTTFANHQAPSRGLDWYFGFQGPGEGTWLDNILYLWTESRR